MCSTTVLQETKIIVFVGSFFADTIKKYSNFVGFPIYLDGMCINTIQVDII